MNVCPPVQELATVKSQEAVPVLKVKGEVQVETERVKAVSQLVELLAVVVRAPLFKRARPEELPTVKPPPVMFNPPANVEVAVAAVPIKYEAAIWLPIKFWKVEDAVVEVALKLEADVKPPTTRLLKISARPAKVLVAVVEVAWK